MSLDLNNLILYNILKLNQLLIFMPTYRLFNLTEKWINKKDL